MTRSATKSSVYALLLSATVFSAENNGKDNPGKPSTGNADIDWSNLSAQARPTPLRPASDGRNTSVQAKANIKQQAVVSRQAAQNAKDFYAQYPGHAKAAEARKLEVVAGLHGVEDGDDNYEKSALALAQNYRDNRTNPASDRLDVALAMDRLKVSSGAKSKKIVPRTTEWEQMADKLQVEFGDQPQLQSYYAELVRSGDMFTSKRIATNLLQQKPAPGAKAEAQAMLDRHSLLGRPLALTVTGLDGGAVDLSKQKGSVTVVFVWAASAGPEVQKMLTRFQRSIPPGVGIMYLALGGEQKKLSVAPGSQPIRGRTCFVPASGSKAAVDYLKLRDMPYLYVLNAKGTLSGFGPVGEFTNLLALAMR